MTDVERVVDRRWDLPEWKARIVDGWTYEGLFLVGERLVAPDRHEYIVTLRRGIARGTTLTVANPEVSAGRTVKTQLHGDRAFVGRVLEPNHSCTGPASLEAGEVVSVELSSLEKIEIRRVDGPCACVYLVYDLTPAAAP